MTSEQLRAFAERLMRDQIRGEDLASLTVKELYEVAKYAAERLRASSHLYCRVADVDGSTYGAVLVQPRPDTTISEADLLAELNVVTR